MMLKNGRFLLLTGLLIVGFCFFGCEGPQGPAGEGAGDVDFRDPTVTLTLPLTSDTVYVDTFYVAAEVTDNDSIDYVEFFLDGTSSLGGDSSAIDDEPPYYLKWNLAGSGHEYGTYPLVAKAVDKTGNAGFSAYKLITYLPPGDQQKIYYFGLGNEEYMTLPDKLDYDDKYFNVRFTPLDTCSVLEVHFKFADWRECRMEGTTNDLTGPCDMDVYLWNSENYLPMEEAVAVKRVTSDNIRFDGSWTIVDFSDINDTFEFDGDFHAGFSPPNETYVADQSAFRALPIVISVNPYDSGVAAQHRSSEMDGSGNWGTMLSHWQEALDFHIRVRVAYSDGNTQMIAPFTNRRVAD